MTICVILRNPSLLEREEPIEMPVCKHLVPVKLGCAKCNVLIKLKELTDAIEKICG